MKHERLQFFTIVIFILGALIVGRLFQLQILKFSFYQREASKSRLVERPLVAKRGQIHDRSGYPLAVNIKSYLLYAVPANIKNPEEIAGALAPFLNIPDKSSEDFKDLVKKLSYKADFYEILKKDLSEEEAREIKELDLRGVKIESNLKM